MDVKQAVVVAKNYVSDLFKDETPMNLGLEEVEFDDRMNEWHVTLGFSRPWESGGGLATALGTARRAYKILRIADDGRVISVKNREGTQ
ncbi:MAG: hypothetical protein JOZ88_14255 [Hyphomicrobiales bacterium]|nr:hypothetical protein [Hyphomicrobiales bacterium]